MRWLAFVTVLATNLSKAQDSDGLARALQRHSITALDSWMEDELHRQRKGVLVTTTSSNYTSHSPTYDGLMNWLRRQPGVLDAEWDRCVSKSQIWPGHSTIGVRIRLGGAVRERCYVIQEGRPGTVNLFGWRPRVRKPREILKLVDVKECPGFVAQQRKHCAGLLP